MYDQLKHELIATLKFISEDYIKNNKDFNEFYILGFDGSISKIKTIVNYVKSLKFIIQCY